MRWTCYYRVSCKGLSAVWIDEAEELSFHRLSQAMALDCEVVEAGSEGIAVEKGAALAEDDRT